MVHGRLTQSSWVNQAGVEVTSLEVDASFVGHDLNRGTSDFTRATGRPRRGRSAASTTTAAGRRARRSRVTGGLTGAAGAALPDWERGGRAP